MHQLHACTSPWNVTCILLQVLKYLRQIAVITPYAQFRFQYTAQDERNSVAITFARRTLKMPVPPAVRTHQTMPHACPLSRADEDHSDATQHAGHMSPVSATASHSARPRAMARSKRQLRGGPDRWSIPCNS